MKLITNFLAFFVIFMGGQPEKNLQEYLDYAIKHYPLIQNISWKIDYVNSFNIQNRHIEIDANAFYGDSSCFVTFSIIPSADSIFVTLMQLSSVVSKNDTLYHTEYNNNFKPKYKYKFTKNNPDSLIFEFGEDIFKTNPLR